MGVRAGYRQQLLCHAMPCHAMRPGEAKGESGRHARCVQESCCSVAGWAAVGGSGLAWKQRDGALMLTSAGECGHGASGLKGGRFALERLGGRSGGRDAPRCRKIGGFAWLDAVVLRLVDGCVRVAHAVEDREVGSRQPGWWRRRRRPAPTRGAPSRILGDPQTT